MTAGLLLGLLAGAAALAFVLAPLFRKDAAEAERLAASASTAQELQSRREMLLAALRDLEDDRSTGKLSDADYDEMKARLTDRAVEIIRRIDEHEQEQARSRRSPRPVRT